MAVASNSVFVGIDVSSKRLDVALGTGEIETFKNDDVGVASLCSRLKALTCELIVLEATGGYEALTVATLAAACATEIPITVLW